MSWIKVIHEQEADGKLKDAYETYGSIPIANILKVHSLFPESFTAHLDFYRTIMFGKSPLSRSDRELIATVVSSLNACHY